MGSRGHCAAGEVCAAGTPKREAALTPSVLGLFEPRLQRRDLGLRVRRAWCCSLSPLDLLAAAVKDGFWRVYQRQWYNLSADRPPTSSTRHSGLSFRGDEQPAQQEARGHDHQRRCRAGGHFALGFAYFASYAA